MTVALVVAVVLGLAAAGVCWSWRPERIVGRQVRKRCLVTLKDGRAFAGVLWEADRTVVILREATVAETGDVVDGELLLQRADVLFVQLP